MANGANSEEDVTDHTFESRQLPDGKIVRLMKNAAGIVVGEDLTSLGRTIENRSFDQVTGALVTRTIYEHDGRRKPLRRTTYDADGDMMLMQERGSPPVVGDRYRGERPFHVYSKKKADPAGTDNSGASPRRV